MSGNTTKEKEKLRLLLEEGHALFMPTRTAAGTPITPSTVMSDLQPLSKEEQEKRPYDIRSWEGNQEIPEQRIAALHGLIKEGRARW
jgi:hypothetical protein